MAQKLPFWGLAALAGCTVISGCHGKNDGPAPLCYAGTVLYNSCVDGTLVQVDEPYTIGQTLPAASAPGGTDLANVIAAVNALPDSLSKPGQRLYFTFQHDSKRQAPYYCFVNRPPLPVPHLVLLNVSADACGPAAP
jgi:hypothetical protein